MSTKIGEMRESLMEAIEMVKKGKLDFQDATAVSKLASEISRSLQVEGQLRVSGLLKESPAIGALTIGHEEEAVDVVARAKLPGTPKDSKAPA